MKINKIIILLLTIIFLIGMNITVKAVELTDLTDNYKINLVAENKTINQGETITISLNISDIDIQTGEKGIGAFEGKIEYDTEVFEQLKMSGNENWDTPAENEGIFTSVNSNGICVQESQEIAQIKLKAKSTAKVGKTTVKIKEFKGSNLSEKMIPTEDTSIEVTIKEVSKPGTDSGNGTGTGTGTSTGNGSGTSSGQTQTQQKLNTSTTKSTTLPKTGVSSTLIVIAGIVLVIGIYGYIRYKTIF